MQGFSLIELSILLFIIVILSFFAIPLTHDMRAEANAIAVSNRLVQAINFSRAMAINKGQPVTLCKSRDHKTCSGHWRDGQIVFIDKAHNGIVQHSEDILRVYSALPRGAQLQWHAFGHQNYLQITPLGFSRQQNGSFYFCPQKNKAAHSRAIIINKAARVHVEKNYAINNCR